MKNIREFVAFGIVITLLPIVIAYDFLVGKKRKPTGVKYENHGWEQ